MESLSLIYEAPAPSALGITPPPSDRRKSPGLAFGLSLLFPGLGHFYCGKHQTGALTAIFFSVAAAMAALLNPATDPLWWGIGFRAVIVLYGFGFLDAFYTARDFNAGISDYIIGNNPRIAAMLNLLTSGFGYFYLGEPKKGLIWFIGSRIFLGATGENHLAIIAEIAAVIVAFDAYRIGRRQLRESFPADTIDPFSVDTSGGLTPLVPIALGAILCFNYAALVSLGLWLPTYTPVDRSHVQLALLPDKSVYGNPKYGFEISVPPDWTINDKSDQFMFAASNPQLGCHVGLLFHSNLPIHGSTGTARQLEKELRARSATYQWLSEGPATLAGKQAYSVTYQITYKNIPVVQRVVFLQHRLTLLSLMETSALFRADECNPQMEQVAASLRLDF